MRRLMLIPAFALFFAVPLWAQHGGGGHGGGGGHAGGGFGGGHAGFSGGHSSGFSGGGHVSGGVRSAPNLAGGVSHGYARGPAFSPRGSANRAFSRPLNRPFLHDGFRGPRNRNFGFRNGCIGFPCRGLGFYSPWGYGYYDPYWYDPNWFWDSDSSDDNGYDQDVAAAAEMNRQNIAQQNEEQQMMRQEQADGDQDIYARPVPLRPVQHEAQGAPILPDTMLVFRDQHKQEVRNYAIVGQTLWNFSSSRTEKIPLSDLDLPATTKANEERGVTFRVPAGGEGQ
jgi:hypothetical protein